MGVRRRAKIAAAILLFVAGCGSAGAPPTPPAGLGQVSEVALPASVLDTPLTNADGKQVTLSGYHGKTMVLADFLTLCQGICPMTSANVAEMAAAKHAGVARRVEYVEAMRRRGPLRATER